jgi:hypothetical protein
MMAKAKNLSYTYDQLKGGLLWGIIVGCYLNLCQKKH